MGLRRRLGLGRHRARRERSGQVADAERNDSSTAGTDGPTPPGSGVDGRRPVVVDQVGPSTDDRDVPRGVRIAAGWSWRLLLVAALVLGVAWVLRYLGQVTIALALAILLTALLSPVSSWLAGRGVPRALAAAGTLILGLALVTGTLTLIGTQIASQADRIVTSASDGVGQLTSWLQNGPIPIPDQYLRFDDLVIQLRDYLLARSETIAQGAADFGSQVGNFFAGLAIALFATFFFLHDGRTIWSFMLKLTPRRARTNIDRAATTGWTALIQYVRATIMVAFVDAIGVFIVALILQVPLAPAIAALVFFLAFIPLVGAMLSGIVAVLVTLVLVGWVQALIMLGGIILVMQLEGNLLQPLLLGRAVKLHPLAVLLGISIGVIIGGIVGALLSIPLLAFTKTFIQKLASDVDGTVGDPEPVRSG